MNWRYLPASNEVIWYSARDDWAHLYLYDLETGKLKHQITHGSWNVVQILKVDEKARKVYFLGVGREPGRSPYFVQLYKVGLDGKQLQLLTPENATHEVSLAPSGRFFIDSYSTPDTPPLTVLRDDNGKRLLELEKADISGLSAQGWVPPTLITVKARDGSTDLHGLLFKPTHFDATRHYPIVNEIYPGPAGRQRESLERQAAVEVCRLPRRCAVAGRVGLYRGRHRRHGHRAALPEVS